MRSMPEVLQHYLRQQPHKPATIADLVVLLESLLDPSAIRQLMNLDGMPNSLIIDDKLLSNWLGESVKTIQNWRMKRGYGPKFVKKTGKVGYRVGDVRDWLKSRTVESTDEFFTRLGR